MNNTWIGFLIIVVPFIVVAVIKLIGKVPNTGRQRTSISLRTKPGSMGSVVGQVIALLAAILIVTYFYNQEMFKSLTSNPFFWAYPGLAVVFYVFFPMGDVIPVKVFKAINTGIMIILIPVIVYTTFFKESSYGNNTDEQPQGQQSVQTIPKLVYEKKDMALDGNWTTLETMPQNGYDFQFYLPDSTIKLEWVYKNFPNTIETLNNLNGFSSMKTNGGNQCGVWAQIRVVSGEKIVVSHKVYYME